MPEKDELSPHTGPSHFSTKNKHSRAAQTETFTAHNGDQQKNKTKKHQPNLRRACAPAPEPFSVPSPELAPPVRGREPGRKIVLERRRGGSRADKGVLGEHPGGAHRDARRSLPVLLLLLRRERGVEARGGTLVRVSQVLGDRGGGGGGGIVRAEQQVWEPVEVLRQLLPRPPLPLRGGGHGPEIRPVVERVVGRRRR